LVALEVVKNSTALPLEGIDGSPAQAGRGKSR
jgi:hypothetical protein